MLRTLALIALLFSASGLKAETIRIDGRVTESGGKPLGGVTVRADAGRFTSTDRDGKYVLSGVEKGAIVSFSLPGYRTKTVRADRRVIDVVLDCRAAEVCEAVEPMVEQEELAVAKMTRSASQAVLVADCAPLPGAPIRFAPGEGNGAEEYGAWTENRFRAAASDPLSTFSIDVDGASYGNLRRMLNDGGLPPRDAVRIEELVNYFPYDYPQPRGGDPVSITTEAGVCPWNRAHRLVRIGIRAREIPSASLPSSNFVFLIDVSGSMYGPRRLGLVVSSLKLLVNNLREQDRVAIVTYSGTARIALPSTSGADRGKIREALESLTAGGSTAGGAGIRTAYAIARENFITGGNNRVILCTDGDFNVGVSSSEGLEELIVRERQSGVFLTVLGYGMGNYKDKKMQTLAEKGNGNHAYIDNLQEANRVLVGEFGSTMHTVAKDVKLQVEFNPAVVQTYRLVGYESRLLDKEDFNDDTKDAGEIGAGQCVTALYEVVPVGAKGNVPGSVDPLRYRIPSACPVASRSGEMLTVKLRYKAPDGETSRLTEATLTDRGRDDVSADFRFASAVAMFGQLLRDSDFRGDATFADVVSVARSGLGADSQGYRREFVRLAETAGGLWTQQQRQGVPEGFSGR